ncbi:Leucine rich repeat protein [Spraguea lophii 42_110]|uniref:Leucine rich repeat protein n=1 Tax=Spraguea lophii (strain 42_110) TaxID=1358809 RepID=S7XP24_SPRLO|nr:Leucine rich repeat protein [Spraguea lophii 42_110]
MKKLPKTLKNCSEVEILDLEKNRLTSECFNTIIELKKLKKLILINNMIDKIPRTICELDNLKCLLIGSNCFREIPKSFTTMNIKILNLDNFFDNSKDKEISYSEKIDILEGAFHMKSLTALSFKDNATGNITMDLNTNSNIEKLNLRNNNISEIPSFILRLEKLKYIDISNNKIVTIIPLNSLKGLEHVKIEENNISDILPGTFYSLENLSISIPPEASFPLSNINEKQKLKTLIIIKNRMSPKFVLDIFKIHTIQSLTLLSCHHENMLNGIEQMTELQELKVYCKTEKVFSPTFSQLKNLQSLSIVSSKTSYTIYESFYDNLKDIPTLKNLEIDLQLSRYMYRLPPIFNIIGLEKLAIRKCLINNLKFFLQLKNLKYLIIERCEVTDMEKEDIINLYKIDGIRLRFILHGGIEWNIKKEVKEEIIKRREMDRLEENIEIVIDILRF